MNHTQDIVANNLAAHMKAQKCTQHRLSALSTVMPYHISNILKGKASPTVDCLDKLSGALGIDTWELLAPPHVIALLDAGAQAVVNAHARGSLKEEMDEKHTSDTETQGKAA